MQNIFPGYLQFDAPSHDPELVQWLAIAPALREALLSDLALPGNDWASISAWNARVNQAISWHAPRADHAWQTPNQTLIWGVGSCMDIALVKLAYLLTAGAGLGCTGVMIGEIRAMPQNLQHAWTLLELEGERRVLDSKFDQLIEPSEYVNWTPLKLLIEDRCVLFSPATVLADQEKGPTG